MAVRKHSKSIISGIAIKFSNVIIGLTTILLFIIFLYLLSRFAVLSHFAKGVVFLLPPGTIALILISRIRPTYRLNFAVMILSTTITVYAFELIQPTGPLFNEDYARIKKWQSLGLDTRSKLEVLENLRNNGQEAITFLIPATFFDQEFIIDGQRIYPLSSLSNITTVLCNETGKWSIYKSDEHGFNNPTGLYKPRDVDIAVIGDSFVQGYCVDSDKNAVALIRKSFPKTLNLGVGGAGPLTNLAIFREYVEPLKPKLVLWIYTERTIGRLAQEKALFKYLSPEFRQGLFNMQPKLDQAFQEYLALVEKTRRYYNQVKNKWVEALLLRGLQKSLLNFVKNKATTIPIEDQYNLFRQTITLAKTTTNSWEGKFIFVYLATPNEKFTSDHDQIISQIQELEIPTIDLNPILINHPDPLSLYPFRKPSHFNEEGYKLVADVILKQINNELYD